MSGKFQLEPEYRDFINEKLFEYLPANRVVRGTNVNFRCPFCGDSKKSATKKRGYYSLSKCVYHCFNCDTSASGLKLLQLFSGESFTDIKTEYIKLRLKTKGLVFNKKNYMAESAAGLPMLSGLKSVVRQSWKHPLSEEAKNYLAARKVLEAPFLKDEFYSYPSKSGVEYILIPWKMNSVACYYQLNDYQKKDKFGRKYIFPRNTEKPVFGLDNIDLSWNKIILFEGVYDSLFVKNGVCVGGKTVTDYQLKILRERYPKHQLVLAFDNDNPGFKSMLKTIEENPGQFKYFKWFNDDTEEKDVNDYVLVHGDVNCFSDPAVLDKMITSAVVMKMHLLKKGVSAKQQRRGK